MFAALTVLLVLNLLSFGGVLPEAWLGSALLWIVLTTIYLTASTLRSNSLDLRFLLLVGGTLLTALLAGPKFATGLFAGVWAWRAAKGHPQRMTNFLHVLLIIGVLEALLGLTQRFLLPGWIFAYQNKISLVSGTLINRNHFAGLIGMLVFVPFGLAYARTRHGAIAGPYLYLLASAFIAFALICSLSRTGVVAFVGAVVFVTIVMRLGSGMRRTGMVLGMGLMGLVLLAVVWIGVDALIETYADLIGPESVIQEARPIIFRDTMRMISDNPWGIGAGNYRYIFRQYQTTRLRLLFDHAHNDYLESAAEWGILVAACFWALVVLILARSVKVFVLSDSFRGRGNVLACIGAVSVLMIFSLADFNLQIPVNASLFFIFLGLSLTCGNPPQLRPATPADLG